MNHKHLFAAGGVATIAGLSILAAWGPLDPPDGPIAPTYKTLTQVEPRTPVSAETTPGDAESLFKISKSGSYYLTGNITGVSGKSGIYIAANRVTLDLNGFTLEGVNGAVAGVVVNAINGVAVRNGAAYNWDIGFDISETNGARLSNLAAANNFERGISVGPAGMVTDCSVTNTSGSSFYASDKAVLTRCSASLSGGGRGFDVRDNCILTECSAATVGIGFYLNGPAVLDRCTATENDSYGFRVEESAILTDCNAFDNGNAGFIVVARSRLTRCTSRSNLEGFYVTEGNSLVECTAAGNSGSGARIIGNSNTVERCTFHDNGADGLYVFSGKGNSIDSNLATYNTLVGIRINEPDNLTVRNRARGNPQGNYYFTANTDYGIVLTNPGQGFSNSAAWANFEY